MVDLEEAVAKVMADYPEFQWLDQCRQKLPGIPDGEILDVIEALLGGDVIND